MSGRSDAGRLPRMLTANACDVRRFPARVNAAPQLSAAAATGICRSALLAVEPEALAQLIEQSVEVLARARIALERPDQDLAVEPMVATFTSAGDVDSIWERPMSAGRQLALRAADCGARAFVVQTSHRPP